MFTVIALKGYYLKHPNSIMKYLDIKSWNRKEHFKFFNQYEEPFFGITLEIDCTIAYQKTKESGSSFFIYYLHKSLQAVNEIEAFRYRIDAQDRVIIHDKINAGATINRPDGTFGFSYIDYNASFEIFEANAKIEIERVQKSNDLIPAPSDDVVFFSSIPWINFTSISHSRSFKMKDSIPKISFGKYLVKDGKKMMPVSIHVNHALMDGFHVGQYAVLFQELLNN